MRNGDCILVFGISGVGKTRACESFVQRHPEFIYLRASQLLSEAQGAAPEELRTAEATQIRSNQFALVHQFHLARQATLGRPVLLDAHAVIDNDRELVAVPARVISALNPDGLILLQARPEDVEARRLIDNRPRPKRTLTELQRESAAEYAAVTEYSRVLKLPLQIVWSAQGFELDNSIERLRSDIRRASSRNS